MKQLFKLTSLSILLAAACLPVMADQTNVVQDLTINLSGLGQGQSVTNGNVVTTHTTPQHIRTADVIEALGTATGSSFSTTAKLVVITPLGGGTSSIAVRDGTTSVDVTAFFVDEQTSGSVGSSQLNLKTGRNSTTDYSIQHLALVDAQGVTPLTLHFDVRGIAVETSLSTATQAGRSQLDAYVSGAGDIGGKVVILEGRIRVQGYTLEVVPDNNFNT